MTLKPLIQPGGWAAESTESKPLISGHWSVRRGTAVCGGGEEDSIKEAERAWGYTERSADEGGAIVALFLYHQLE